MRIVVGLGNPGADYRDTRHNIGWMVVDALARRLPPAEVTTECASRVLQSRYAGKRVALVWPQTYMNRSGEAARALLRRFKVGPEALVVVYDEVELTAGRIRLRTRGSDAGHRGMRSIIDSLGTEAFPRLRLGIGRPTTGEELADWVLEEFDASELAGRDDLIERGVEALQLVLRHGPEKSMNRVNRPPESTDSQASGTPER